MNLENKIRAMMILEIIGKPAEHIISTLEQLIEQMKKEQNIEIVSKTIKEAKEIEKQPGFYSSFAEIEVMTDNIMYIAMLMFKYMPAYVQIIEPEKISISNNDLGELFSELTRKLHGYDEVARVLQFQKMQLESKLKELTENSSKQPNTKKNKSKKE